MKLAGNIDAEVTCLCGGDLMVSLNGVLLHSLPTCADYDACETMDDAAELVKRVREKMERN